MRSPKLELQETEFLEFSNFLAVSDFMPHGYCYLWDPWLVWLNVLSDGLITLSYYCIPLVLIYFFQNRRDFPFNWISWMFGAFILACGTTHLMEIWNVWHANYLLAGVVKAVTAVVSVVIAIRLIPLVPKAVSVSSLIHLQEKNRQNWSGRSPSAFGPMRRSRSRCDGGPWAVSGWPFS